MLFNKLGFTFNQNWQHILAGMAVTVVAQGVKIKLMLNDEDRWKDLIEIIAWYSVAEGV